MNEQAKPDPKQEPVPEFRPVVVQVGRKERLAFIRLRRLLRPPNERQP